MRFSFRFGYEDISYKYFDSCAELKIFLTESLPAFEKVRELVNPKYAKKVWFLMNEIETRRMNVGGITFSNGFVICGKVGAVCHEYAHAVSEDFMERTESYWTGEALPMYCGASFGAYYAEELLNIYIKIGNRTRFAVLRILSKRQKNDLAVSDRRRQGTERSVGVLLRESFPGRIYPLGHGAVRRLSGFAGAGGARR